MKIITISGASGSGKSTLAAEIEKSVSGSLLLSLDRYYLSKAEQIDKNGYCNFDYPTAIDDTLLKEHLCDLKRDGMANVPVYDFTISERAGYERLEALGTIIIDGLFSGSLLADEADLSIFVDVDLELALERRIERDMRERDRSLESVIEQYQRDVLPAYYDHIEPLKSTADMVLTNNTSIDELLKETRKILALL